MAYQQQPAPSLSSSSSSQPPSDVSASQLSRDSHDQQQHAANPAAAMLPPQIPTHSNISPVNNLASGNTVSNPAQVPSPPKPQPNPAAPMTAAAAVAPPQASPNAVAPTQNSTVSPKLNQLSQREQDQVSGLLSLNTLLLREAQKLQVAGATTQNALSSPQQQNAPATNQQGKQDNTRDAQKSPTGAGQTPTSTTPTPQTPKGTKPSSKAIYDNLVRRVQIAIAFLLALSQGKPVPPSPPVTIMEPPPVTWFIPGPDEVAPDDAEAKGRESYGEVKAAYQRLRELWPNYQGPRASQQMRSQQQQVQQGQRAANSVPGVANAAGAAPPQQTVPPAQAQPGQEQKATQQMPPQFQPGPNP